MPIILTGVENYSFRVLLSNEDHWGYLTHREHNTFLDASVGNFVGNMAARNP
jgi:hypothetical protein